MLTIGSRRAGIPLESGSTGQVFQARVTAREQVSKIDRLGGHG